MSTLNETWRTSTRSGTNGACVEVRYTDGVIQLRDSKNREGSILDFAPDGWAAFISGVKDSEFELPR
jgi:hypothetical protein